MTGLDALAKAFAFCPRCRAPMAVRHNGGRLRPVCPHCDYVQYLNPAPGAAVILRRGREICLVRRRFAPHEGRWTLPTGFMEWDEDIETTAVRETFEETGLQVRLTGLFAVHTGVLPPDQPVVVVFYTAEETGGELRPGDDAAAVGFYALDALPGPIAFAVHRRVLSALGADLEV
ncbi:MAG: NUDIX hydrolase [Candidatus Krumholzibacteria bacterium]|jgi:ADP-ribose pyrophosphatase YjhB (NUDIX family)|nr:NUDIX hydrolase [Candidatus Krumholzibacteria bacterium]